MQKYFRRWSVLVTLSAGTLFADSCDVTGAILDTIGLAFGIVDVWV